MKLLRPPYGALTETMRRWTYQSFGYRTILWDVDPLDWKVRDAGRVQSEILGHARSGSIVLAHDIHKSTVDAMPDTLDALAAKGFKFVTVSELIAMDKPGEPGQAIRGTREVWVVCRQRFQAVGWHLGKGGGHRLGTCRLRQKARPNDG
jgi:hypothetical protein